MTRLALLVVLSAAVLGCRGPRAPGEVVDQGESFLGGTEQVSYVHDTKHKVGCWFYVGTSTTSISCLPDSQYTVQP